LCILKIGFATSNSLGTLKLIEAGVPKENIMLIQTPLFVVKMILPLVVAKYTSGPKPMNVYLTATPFR